MSYLQRYQAGEHEAAWRDLCELDKTMRTPDLLADAEAVALTIMTRVAANVDMIVERLEARGYAFGLYPDGKPILGVPDVRTKPSAELLTEIKSLQVRVGALPLSLSSFWQVVGEVCLVGRAPEGEMPDYSDPLWVEGPAVALADLDEGAIRKDGDKGFFCPIAPDIFHKDNVSGGEPYAICIPNEAFDAPFDGEWHEVAFVPYLRTAILDWGGFPGLSEFNPQHRWRRGLTAAPWVADLKSDLVPF